MTSARKFPFQPLKKVSLLNIFLYKDLSLGRVGLPALSHWVAVHCCLETHGDCLYPGNNTACLKVLLPPRQIFLLLERAGFLSATTDIQGFV